MNWNQEINEGGRRWSCWKQTGCEITPSYSLHIVRSVVHLAVSSKFRFQILINHNFASLAAAVACEGHFLNMGKMIKWEVLHYGIVRRMYFFVGEFLVHNIVNIHYLAVQHLDTHLKWWTSWLCFHIKSGVTCGTLQKQLCTFLN